MLYSLNIYTLHRNHTKRNGVWTSTLFCCFFRPSFHVGYGPWAQAPWALFM